MNVVETKEKVLRIALSQLGASKNPSVPDTSFLFIALSLSNVSPLVIVRVY